MTLEALIRSELWANFETHARKEKKQPIDLLAELVREHLEIAEDIALTKAIRRQALKSGYKESDAVRIVREYRAEKRRQRVAS